MSKERQDMTSDELRDDNYQRCENPDHMHLWNIVCETDPQITKKVNARGGFTSVDAQVQIKNATNQWGPYGDKWGVKNLKFEIIRDEQNKPFLITLDAVFYYPYPTEKNIISFEMGVDMDFSANNTKADYRKKLLTDFTTKALSKVGFNSDVFEGKFDDNKYVAELKQKRNQPLTPQDMQAMQNNNNPTMPGMPQAPQLPSCVPGMG